MKANPMKWLQDKIRSIKTRIGGRKPLRTRFEREVRAVLAAFDRLREATIAGVNFRLGRPVAA